MDTKNLSLLFKTSLLAASMSMVVGCSENPIPTAEATTDSISSEIDTAVETAAKTGTIVNVADPYAVGCKVTFGDYEAVEIDSENAPGKYLLAGGGGATGTIKATGCMDYTTGISLAPLSSYFDDRARYLTQANLTPITTMIEGYRLQGRTIIQARERTSSLLGLPLSKLELDPVTSAVNGDAEIGNVSSKLTAIAKTFQKSGQTDPIAELAKATIDSTDTIDNEIQKDSVINAVITDPTKRASAKTIAKVVADAITKATTGNSGVDSLNAAAKIIKKASTSTNSADLTSSDNLVNAASSETISTKGLKTVEINTSSAEFTKAVTKVVNKVKADPENNKVVSAEIKTAVQSKITELKTINAVVAAQIKATASSESAKEDQARADVKVATAVETDVKAELEKAAAAAKAAAEAAAKAAAEAAAATDAAAAEAAANTAASEADKAANTVSGGLATTN